jgi:hypothetical protein
VVRRNLTLIVAFSAFLALLSIGGQVQATVTLTTDRTVFLGSNSIVSTETFDEFVTPTQFPIADQTITISGVSYFSAISDPGWTVSNVFVTSSPPNVLFANALGDRTISFDGGYVRSVGLIFRAVAVAAQFHFVVREIDGTLTDFVRLPNDGLTDFGYLGFSSSIGIESVLVSQQQGQGFVTNFTFDDVSRSAVISFSSAVPVPVPLLDTDLLVVLALLLTVTGVAARSIGRPIPSKPTSDPRNDADGADT